MFGFLKPFDSKKTTISSIVMFLFFKYSSYIKSVKFFSGLPNKLLITNLEACVGDTVSIPSPPMPSANIKTPFCVST